jgi:hypothetical protein
VFEAEAAPDFWTRAGIGDLRLSDLLVTAASDSSGPAALEEAAHGITVAYIAAFRLRSSARERDSVTTHLRDLVDVVPAGTDMARILHDVHHELRRWTSSEAGAA